MEASVEKLEAMFSKAESDLDFIHRKLENEFTAHCDSTKPDQVNTVQLLDRIADIKGEYQAIVEDAKEIKKAQTDAMQYFQSHMASACSALMQLQLSSGLMPEKPEELERFEEMVGATVPLPCTSKQSDTASTSTAKQPTERAEVKAMEATITTKQTGSSYQAAEPLNLSPHAKRAKSQQFIEVTEAEFETVSSLIRGRVKLSDVNLTYQILWSHFKDNPESDPLSAADMHKMGLRVTGKTGDAKLKVLRALKLLSISKSGNVTML